MNRPASKKVVVTDFTFPDVARERAAATRNGAAFESHMCKTACEAADAVDGADVAVVQFVNFDAAAIARLRPGATILRYGIGFDNIDVAAAVARGIRVGYVPDYCVDEVADHTVTAILTLRQKLYAQDRAVRDGRWSAVEFARPLQGGPDTTIGFLGLGRIGSAVLARLRPFGFRFAVADPALDDAHAAELGVVRVEVDRLFEIADVLTLHAPAAPSTIDIVGAANLARMKPTAFIVNAARGALVDEAALAHALREGRIAGAALDVFKNEPLAADSDLRRAPNLILTPHAAWYSDSAIVRLQALIAADIERALRGEAPRCPVPGSRPTRAAVTGGALTA